MLSDDELKALANDCAAGKALSFTTADELISTLDEYIETKPDYASACHPITLRGWVADKVREQHVKRPRGSPTSVTAADIEAYEKWGKAKLAQARLAE